ncbi:unnamed protein product [Prorocentrum cordatum]|uniref:Pentacotripeptide-repeat region of PRORP domain-containing protein n=1 Tax=Prorocentrum cordatum TaxID=2364126 RepID=A0ABN9T8Q7_9DINO|nr:unnamed protein product [Polarella glacialis]
MLEVRPGFRHGGSSLEATIKSCGRIKQWNAALQLFLEASRLRSTATPGQYLATVGACGKGRQWQRALALLAEMWEAKLEPNVVGYSAGISACEKGEQWQRALTLLAEMRVEKLEPDSATMLGSARARKARSVSGP